MSVVSHYPIKCECQSRLWTELSSKNQWVTMWDETQQHLLPMRTAALSHRLPSPTLLKTLSQHFCPSDRLSSCNAGQKKQKESQLQTPPWAMYNSTARCDNKISPLDGTLTSEKAGGLAFTPADADWWRVGWGSQWKYPALSGAVARWRENKLQTASDVKLRGTSRNHQSGSKFGLILFFFFVLFLVKSFSWRSATHMLCCVIPLLPPPRQRH